MGRGDQRLDAGGGGEVEHLAFVFSEGWEEGRVAEVRALNL